MRAQSVFSPILAAVLLLALTSTDSSALKRRPTVGGTYEDCIADRHDGSTESGCEGLLCWCCYADGCFICNNRYGGNPPTDDVGAELADCTWDPAYSATRPPGSGSQPNQPFQQQFQKQFQQLDRGQSFTPQPVRPPVSGPLDGAVGQ